MVLSITQSATAVAPRCLATFAAAGGAEPYVWSVDSGGGSIDGDGRYTAPAAVGSSPQDATVTIRVTDDDAATATTTILVGTPLLLFCEILQRELALAPGRVYLWDQKIMQPTDNGLYVAVSVPSCRPFANVNRTEGSEGGVEAQQYVAMAATVDVDIISRGPAARDRKEEVILALNSIYAQQQQEACSFFIGKLPYGRQFLNLSNVDGAAIPYRYRISVALQYAFEKASNAAYFDEFESTETTDP